MLRTGGAGSNTAADHIETTRLALAQLPRRQRRRVLVRTDSAGGTHSFLEWLTAPSRRCATTASTVAGWFSAARPWRRELVAVEVVVGDELVEVGVVAVAGVEVAEGMAVESFSAMTVAMGCALTSGQYWVPTPTAPGS